MSSPRERAFDLAGIGSAVVDRLHRVERLLRGDGKELVAPWPGGVVEQRRAGGVVVNHLAWAALCGLRTAIVGKGADDADGGVLREGIAAAGIADHLVRDGCATAFSLVLVDGRGRRSIYMSRGATAEVTAAEVRSRHAAILGAADWVSTEVSQLPLPAVVAALEVARAAGARTLLDVDVGIEEAVPALGSARELRAALRLADVVKTTRSAAASLGARGGPLAAARALRQRLGSWAVVITDGARGCALAGPGFTGRVPSPGVDVVDSTGAGDAFLGGFAAGLAWGWALADAARLGCVCGAACCMDLGAVPAGVTARQRVEALLGRVLPAPMPGARGTAPGEARAETGVPTLFGTGREDGTGPGAADLFLGHAVAELGRLRRRIGARSFDAALAAIREREARGGRLHVTGVGKSEHVAHYAAALFSSTGTPATFLHATEATHGSLGQVRPEDLVVAVSNSGATPELLRAVAGARALGAGLVAVVGNLASPLARQADAVLPAAVEREGGPLGLAPRASVLAATLVLAALSVALEAAKGLTRNQFHRLHPGGVLGRASAGE